MKCSIELGRKARKFLKDYPRDVIERVETKLRELSENPVCEETKAPTTRAMQSTRRSIQNSVPNETLQHNRCVHR